MKYNHVLLREDVLDIDSWLPNEVFERVTHVVAEQELLAEIASIASFQTVQYKSEAESNGISTNYSGGYNVTPEKLESNFVIGTGSQEVA